MQMTATANFASRAMEGCDAPCDSCTMRIRLHEIREGLGLSQEVVADRAGVSVSQISRWEAGGSNIPSGRLSSLADAYECRISDIFDDDDGRFVSLGPPVPIRGPVAAGQWHQTWELGQDEQRTLTGRADVTVPMRDRFGVRVEGDSMNEVYPHGTILECVAFYAGAEIESGRRVIVQRRRNGDEYEVTVKEYHRDAEGVEWLVPRSRNPAFQNPIRADQQDPDIDEVQIIGVVVGSYRKED
jgi:transcriptional regulator with XRE-family HTH domain